MNEHEKFVRLTERRRSVLLFDKVDPALGQFWSAPIDSVEFLMALQKIDGDEWDELHNQPFWHYLHIGGSAPH